MTTSLPSLYQPGVLDAQMQYAKALAQSSLLPRQYQQQPANLLWAISYGQTLGVDPMTAVQGVHVINGKPTASADLIAGLVRRAGHKLRVNGDDKRAVAQIIRADDPDFTFEAVWTIERAQAAKLTGKDTWKQFPAAMLRARAITEVARAACSEILHGTVYTPEELGANVDADGVPVEAPVRELRRVQPGEPDQWQTPDPAAEDRQDYMVRVGNAVVRRDAFSPHPEGQAFAKRASEATDRAAVTAIVGEAKEASLINSGIEAPDSGEPDVLRDYLARRWKALPKEAAPTEVVDAEVVEEAGDERAAAIDQLRAAAMNAGMADDLEAAFQQSYGVTLADAPVQQLREMTQLLNGTAA